jgi:ABC-type branched-subunit amino acid transport system substrate-binding protein
MLAAIPTALLLWYRKSRSKVALGGYLLMSLWIVVGFGLMKGLWKGGLRLFLGTFLASVATSFPKPVIGSVIFELSGLLTFIGGAFVAYYAYKLVRSIYAPQVETKRHSQLVAGSAAAVVALGAIGLASAYVVTDRDRFVAPTQGVVKIGVIVPTTGPYALLGNSYLKAVQMAREDLKGTKYQYELVIRDVGSDPAKAAAVIRQVVNDDKVDAIVGGISLIGLVTKPYATKARIPHVCVCTVKAIPDGAYNFSNIPTPEAEATLWVREAQRRGIARVAILSQDHISINGHVGALKAEAARAGLTVTYERRFEAEQTDFREMIAAAEASKPDVLYVEAVNPALDLLGQQLRDAGVRNISSVVAPSLSQKPELFEGVWYTDSNLRDLAFRKRFEDKYPGTQFATHMMPYAYDSLNMIVQAYEHGENPAVYLRNLRSYDGTADTLTKEPGSGIFRSAPSVWVIKDGKPTLISGH